MTLSYTCLIICTKVQVYNQGIHLTNGLISKQYKNIVICTNIYLTVKREKKLVAVTHGNTITFELIKYARRMFNAAGTTSHTYTDTHSFKLQLS